MNLLLHNQKCPQHIVPQPDGLKELMADISREVIRAQPENIHLFIADFLETMLMTRESAKIAQATIDDVMSYAVDVATFYVTTCMPPSKARHCVSVFQRHFKETFDDIEAYCDDNSRFNECVLMQRLMEECDLKKDEALKAMKIIRDAYKKYYYRRTRFEATPLTRNDAAWDDKVKNTLYIYSQAKPTQEEMTRAAVCLQAAYRGYCVRKKVNEQREKAAILIQSVVRGHWVREKLEQQRQPSTSNEKAALVVQNIYRGQKVRKSLESQKSGSSKTGLDDLLVVQSLELPPKPKSLSRQSSMQSIKSKSSLSRQSSMKSFKSSASSRNSLK